MALILEHKLNASQASGQQPKSIFLKSYEYVNRVKRFKNKEAVTQVRQCVKTLRPALSRLTSPPVPTPILTPCPLPRPAPPPRAA